MYFVSSENTRHILTRCQATNVRKGSPCRLRPHQSSLFWSLLHEVHVTVPLQEFKITHPVKFILRTQFHFCILDDLG